RMEKQRGLGSAPAAHLKSSPEVCKSQCSREIRQVEQIADVDPQLKARHGGHGNFDQLSCGRAPTICLRRSQPIGERPKKIPSFLQFGLTKTALHELIGT